MFPNYSRCALTLLTLSTMGAVLLTEEKKGWAAILISVMRILIEKEIDKQIMNWVILESSDGESLGSFLLTIKSSLNSC